MLLALAVTVVTAQAGSSPVAGEMDVPAGVESLRGPGALLVPEAPADLPAVDSLDQPEPRVRAGDDARVRRFVGALAGGLVGAALGIAASGLLGPPCAGFACSPSAGQLVLGALTPLVTFLGLFSGYQLLGGHGDAGLGALSLIPGSLVALAMLLLVPQSTTTLGGLLPYMTAGLVVTLGVGALTLDAREPVMAGPDGHRAGVRFWAGAGVSFLSMALSTLVGALVGASCFECIAAGFAVGGLLAAGSTTLSWFTHRALGGKGNFFAGLAGLGVAALTIVGAVLLGTPSFGSPSSTLLGVTAAPILASYAMVLAPVLLVPAALELSHALTVRERSGSLAVSAGPLPGGGGVTASLRF